MVVMVIEGNVLQSHPVGPGVLQGSPISQLLFGIHTTGLIKWVDERVQAESLSFVDYLRWVRTGKDGNVVVEKLQASASESIEWSSRRVVQFDTAKTETALLTCRKRHNKHLQPKLRAEINVGNGLVRFNDEVMRWL
jgi:hypothetical protein